MLPSHHEHAGCRFQKLATLEFDRKRKSMSVIVRGTGAGAQNLLLVKGAAECVIERCSTIMLASGAVKPMTAPLRQALLASVDSMAEGALRCLALAQKVCSSQSTSHHARQRQSVGTVPAQAVHCTRDDNGG